jgi:hypothetical protein
MGHALSSSQSGIQGKYLQKDHAYQMSHYLAWI